MPMSMIARRMTLLGVAVSGALLVNRELGRRWGATSDEVHGALPGDEVIAAPRWATTHAITIAAPPADVWPWLAQMGITRGGWYLSQRLDRIVWRIDNPSVDRIVPELQRLAIGDVIPDSVNGTAHFRVVGLEPERALVLHSRRHPTTGIWPDSDAERPGWYLDFSWAFVLRALPDRRSRLLLRTRAAVMRDHAAAPRWTGLLLPLADFADFIYTRQMLRGIRRRAEAHRASGTASERSNTAVEPRDRELASVR